jgi:hypothetical protein
MFIGDTSAFSESVTEKDLGKSYINPLFWKSYCKLVRVNKIGLKKSWPYTRSLYVLYLHIIWVDVQIFYFGRVSSFSWSQSCISIYLIKPKSLGIVL